MAREPGYCRHKPTGQAYVNFGGRVIYLGTYGTEESKEKYHRLKAEWLLNRHSPKFQPKKNAGPFMADLCLVYLDFAEGYYPTGNEYLSLEMATRPISELYGTLPCSEFGTVEYETCRNWWVQRGTCSRKTINGQMQRLVRILKWGVAKGMVPVGVYQTIRCVDPLKRGRCDAREIEPIKPVTDSLVDATIPFLTDVVADMVRFQMLVGCRPGELVSITPAMVNRTSEVWTINLAKHKTAYRGKQRVIYVGPRAQAIISKYLLRAGDAPCFSPIESEKQRLAAKHKARVTPLQYGNSPGTNRIARKPRRAPGTAFTAGTYGRSILNATRRAKIEEWSPNQLRHSAATAIRKEFGLEAAQVILGHSELGVTQVYAERDTTKAIEVAMKIG